jgi:hypothetical protein
MVAHNKHPHYDLLIERSFTSTHHSDKYRDASSLEHRETCEIGYESINIES